MKLQLESTGKTYLLNGVESRVWRGKTKSGVRFYCFLEMHRVIRFPCQRRTPRSQCRRLKGGGGGGGGV